jgi:hypothetical protein
MSALTVLPSAQTLRTCTCGLALTDARWLALPWVGRVDQHRWHGHEFRLELRNCVCASTIGVLEVLVGSEWFRLDAELSRLKESEEDREENERNAQIEREAGEPTGEQEEADLRREYYASQGRP